MTPPIDIIMKPLEHTRTPERPCLYFAFALVDGRRFGAWSRYGASSELARKLVAAGVPDAPLRVRQRGIAGHLIWPSLHAAAKWTYRETKTQPLHRVRWVDPQVQMAILLARKRENRG